MLRILIKKQMMEIFRMFFYDAKKNAPKPKGKIILSIVLYAVLIFGVVGGSMGAAAFGIFSGTVPAGAGWLGFLILAGIALLVGVIATVFSTFTGVYLAKDNDLLLSMPIPVSYIVAARLVGVYLTGLIYSGAIMVPSAIVYIIFAGISLQSVLGGLAMIVLISLLVLVLACLLGWVVAKLSRKFKNKTAATVILSVLAIGIYYVFYFRAQTFIRELVENAQTYGADLKTNVYSLYLFGSVGEGNPLSILICFGALAILMGLTWLLLSKTFLSIATTNSAIGTKKTKAKAVKQKSMRGALIAKEFKKLGSSANYLLNCAFGTLFIPIGGIALIIFGPKLYGSLEQYSAEIVGVLLSAALCMICTMNDMATPSVSLEGKSMWIIKSLPVETRDIIWAKVMVEIIMTEIPMIFASVVLAIVTPVAWYLRILIALLPIAFVLFQSIFDMVIGIKGANLTWTNEMVPTKQSGNIALAIFMGWIYALIVGGAYIGIAFIVPPEISGAIPIGVYSSIYLALIIAITLGGTFLLKRWLATKGASEFDKL